MNALLAARQTKVKRIVHTSTSEVYGTAMRVPIDETHPLQGQSPYSASKIAADKLAESFYRSYDLPVVTLRPFNTYGPRQSTRAVIPTIITQALTQDIIYLGNLDATRDLTYVSDTVEGFLSAGQAQGIEGGTFNLGVGYEALKKAKWNVCYLITGWPKTNSVGFHKLLYGMVYRRQLNGSRQTFHIIVWVFIKFKI
jgi:dTDP-glucose 4,6-dehydratase